MSEMISVVIPVYNVEKYLSNCLDSVLNQTYENLEIILVDDGSCDGSRGICDRYAARDQRIKVIHKEKNEGQAAARNMGMELASGEYLFFADSDDWLAQDALDKLYDGMKRFRTDCCAGTCVNMLEDKHGEMNAQRRKHDGSGERCETAKEAMKHVLLEGSAAWNRLYKRQILEGIRFPEGRINEDEPFMLWVYERVERIAFLDCETYFYRKRANSTTTSAFSVKMVACVYNSRGNLEFVTDRVPELIPAAEYKYCKSLLWCYVNLFKLKDQQAKTLRRQLHKEIREHWKMALSNPYLGFPLKILTLICLL